MRAAGTIAALVAMATLAAGDSIRAATRGLFVATHDGLLNLHRIAELGRCTHDGQLFCRWSANMGGGLGSPVLQFYPPLSTRIAWALEHLGADVLQAAHLTAALAMLFATAGAYACVRTRCARPAALAAAVSYAFAPYLATDLYVRGALAELVGLAWLPWVFATALRLLDAPRARATHVIAHAVSFSGLALSHLLVTGMAIPFHAGLLLVIVIGLERSARVDALRRIAISVGLAVALSAVYTAPALLERDLVQLDLLAERLPATRVERNFVSASELLFAGGEWGTGPFRRPGGMTVRIGEVTWGGTLAIAVALAGLGLKRRRVERDDVLALGFAAAGGLSLFLALPIAGPIYRAIPTLAFLQFPWRWVGIASFVLAVALGFGVDGLARRFPGKAGRWAGWSAFAIVTTWTIIAQGSLFRFAQPAAARFEAADAAALTTPLEIARLRHGLYDYLPAAVDADALPRRPPKTLPPIARLVDPTSGEVLTATRTSDRIQATVRVERGPARLRLSSFDFPGWHATVDGLPVAIDVEGDPLARIHVPVPTGTHEVDVRFTGTPLRNASSTLSLLAWGGVLVASVRAGFQSERNRAEPALNG